MASFPLSFTEEMSPKPGGGWSGQPPAERSQMCRGWAMQESSGEGATVRGPAGRRQRVQTPLEGALR